MRAMDEYLILLIPVGILVRRHRTRYRDFALGKEERQFWAAANFGKLKLFTHCQPLSISKMTGSRNISDFSIFWWYKSLFNMDMFASLGSTLQGIGYPYDICDRCNHAHRIFRSLLRTVFLNSLKWRANLTLNQDGFFRSILQRWVSDDGHKSNFNEGKHNWDSIWPWISSSLKWNAPSIRMLSNSRFFDFESKWRHHWDPAGWSEILISFYTKNSPADAFRMWLTSLSQGT
jgi:hypothetical protein